VQVIVNGIDVSALLQFTGSAHELGMSVSMACCRTSSIPLPSTVTDASGYVTTASVNNFDTFSQSNLTIEAEEF